MEAGKKIKFWKRLVERSLSGVSVSCFRGRTLAGVCTIRPHAHACLFTCVADQHRLKQIWLTLSNAGQVYRF